VKKCFYCGEEIQDAVLVCQHCGRDLVASGSVPQKGPKGKDGKTLIKAGVVCLIVLGVAIGLAWMGGLFPTASNQPACAVLPQSVDSPALLVTRDQFDRIVGGMTQEQIFRIIGTPPEQVHIPGERTDDNRVAYRWMNWNGSRLAVVLKDGRLIEKAECGLQ